ncbi:MAG: N-acetylmuramoyl-L-alanine amidase [Deltaproteobacteria bacterium]|nr:N-acetylmuramoyl-L-alanine amidase [Deltaproteobacteria bacterium]
MMNRKKITVFLIALVVLSLFASFASFAPFVPDASAQTAKSKYFAADSAWKKLRNNPKRQKYRDQWFACIRRYEAVYKLDPNGEWAAAGLFKAGQLYYSLSRRSYLDSDRQEAIDIFERIIKRYPKSAYANKAAAEIRKITKTSPKRSVSTKSISSKGKPPSGGSRAKTAKDKYYAADAAYKKLRKSPRKLKYRDQWLVCINKYKAVYDHNPRGEWAAAGLYKTGKLYYELYKRSSRKSDKKNSIDTFERIVRNHPGSRYNKRAVWEVKRITGRNIQVAKSDTGTTETTKDKFCRPETEISLASEPKGISEIRNIRYWSNPSYTRVVIDADKDTRYHHRLLKEDPSIHKPPRLYVDLDRSVLCSEFDKVIPINDNLLKNARVGQHTPDSVRVVVDIKSFDNYKIFSLKNPFRIVIDVWGKKSGNRHGGKQYHASKGSTKNSDKILPSAIAKQFALGVKRIVIDPGHGGRDYGAPGYLKGVHEKYVVLSLAKKLAARIKKDLGCEVVLTRNNNKFLTLEERTAIANTKNADLFISLHTNAARSRHAYGIETYFLNLATDADAIRVAAKENATSEKNISDLQSILTDLMQNAKINESSRLATHVHESMCKNLKKKYSRIKSKGVKQAPFYVLLGAQMPSILIETAFISNPRECKRLVDPKYQENLCKAIVDGIRNYMRETNPTAFINKGANYNKF